MFDLNDPEVRRALKKYKNQRYFARRRGVGFLMTFEEWYQWWLDSGHWYERGREPDLYVMGRKDDIGPYHIDNIICIQSKENIGDSKKIRYPSKQCLACQHATSNDIVTMIFQEEKYRVPDRHCLKCPEFEFKTIEEKQKSVEIIDLPDLKPNRRGPGKVPAKSNKERQQAHRDKQKLLKQQGISNENQD